MARGEVAPIAEDADAAARFAGQHRADLDPLDAQVRDRLGRDLVDLRVGLDDLLLGHRIGDILGRDAADDAFAQFDDLVFALVDRLDPDPVDRAAILLEDDDVLGDVDQLARQVAGIGGLQRGIGQPLARAVRRDEVLEHAETFAEVRQDRPLDDFARRLGHQPAHAGQLADLLARTAGLAVHHDEHGVQLQLAVVVLHGGVHRVRDPVRGVGPDVDDFVVAFAVGDDPAPVLLLDIGDFLQRFVDDLVLFLRHDHVLDAD